MQIKLGTRRSQLALAQANIVANELKKCHNNLDIQIVEIVTTGDKLYNANLALIGGKGLFLKEIEDQLLLGNIDIAVHSMKDVPAFLPEGLMIGCTLKRADPRDAYISFKYPLISDLPIGAVIGTSSSRRREQLLAMRSDLKIVQFRGNVNTRISKVENGEVDACLLALAGLERINLEHKANVILSVEEMIPAVCQGVICVESRINDLKINQFLSKINHQKSFIVSTVERSFMKELSGNCTTPLAAYAKIEGDSLHLKCGYYSERKQKFLIAEVKGTLLSPEKLGIQGAEIIKSML